MAYSDKVIDHYNNPRNLGSLPKDDQSVGTGIVGAPECGDVMKLQIKVQNDVIVDAKFKTFGCGSAIASSSLATEWLKGRTVEDAYKIKNTDIVQELNLPPVKIHCSVLAEDAIIAALVGVKIDCVAQTRTASAFHPEAQAGLAETLHFLQALDFLHGIRRKCHDRSGRFSFFHVSIHCPSV